MWQIMHVNTLESEYFKYLKVLVEKYNLKYTSVQNAWHRAKKETPDELERFIVMGEYRITKIQIK